MNFDANDINGDTVMLHKLFLIFHRRHVFVLTGYDEFFQPKFSCRICGESRVETWLAEEHQR